MNDEQDLDRILRDHEYRVDPRVKRDVLREFDRSVATRGRARKTLVRAAVLALLLGASFYAGRITSASNEGPPATKPMVRTDTTWYAAENDLL